ncbi:MAG: hypothetical protein HQ564_01575 [Candidatus Saganbacteria bacterium]|nr:hypothetical protein [Candidatus Saganbacteria bacterium]
MIFKTIKAVQNFTINRSLRKAHIHEHLTFYQTGGVYKTMLANPAVPGQAGMQECIITTGKFQVKSKGFFNCLGVLMLGSAPNGKTVTTLFHHKTFVKVKSSNVLKIGFFEAICERLNILGIKVDAYVCFGDWRGEIDNLDQLDELLADNWPGIRKKASFLGTELTQDVYYCQGSRRLKIVEYPGIIMAGRIESLVRRYILAKNKHEIMI